MKNETVKRLCDLGAVIHIGHEASNLDNSDVVVASTAVTQTNVEVIRAHELGIPVIPRAEMLAELMRLKHEIAAGSHKADHQPGGCRLYTKRDWTLQLSFGLESNQLGSNARLGKGQYLKCGSR